MLKDKDIPDAIDEIYDHVEDFFSNDRGKVKGWFNTPNPLLGNITPNEMMKLGRIEKLLDFVRTQVAENSKLSAPVELLH